MGKSDRAFEKKMEIKRTRNRLAGNLEKLEQNKRMYIEKAKEALKRGDKHSYSLARSGLASTVAQLSRTREMLLNIDITSQMRDTGSITEEFLTGMETIFKQLGKINKSVNIKKARNGLRTAITGMAGVQAQLDGMLMESEENFSELSSGSANVSDKELDALLGIETAADENEIGAELDKVISSAKEEKTEKKAEQEKEQTPPPRVYKIGTSTDPVTPPAQEQEKPKAAAKPTSKAPAPEEKEELKINWGGEYDFEFPPLDLLDDYATDAAVREANERELVADAQEAEKILAELAVPARVANCVAGPSFSRLEMVMPVGMSVQKVVPLVSDIAMRLQKPARFEVPIAGKNAFGIEVPNARRETVGLKELVGSQEFTEAGGGIKYSLAVDIDRKPVIKDLSRAPHMIIAGSTGSGKSCFLHSLITSLMYKYSPAKLRLAIVDFKRVEMAVYNGIPYLLTDKVVDDDTTALQLFNALCDEMERRYEMFVQSGCRNIEEYNQKASGGEHMPYIATFVDEYADISTSPLNKEFDTVIRKLSQKARASGIHLVLATQRPSTDVISGTIKNNFPVQIAFKVARKEDSRTTLAGQSGAEMLLGNGDMLYNEPSGNGLHRMQSPFVSSEELRRVTDWVITHAVPKR